MLDVFTWLLASMAKYKKFRPPLFKWSQTYLKLPTQSDYKEWVIVFINNKFVVLSSVLYKRITWKWKRTKYFCNKTLKCEIYRWDSFAMWVFLLPYRRFDQGVVLLCLSPPALSIQSLQQHWNAINTLVKMLYRVSFNRI